MLKKTNLSSAESQQMQERDAALWRQITAPK